MRIRTQAQSNGAGSCLPVRDCNTLYSTISVCPFKMEERSGFIIIPVSHHGMTWAILSILMWYHPWNCSAAYWNPLAPTANVFIAASNRPSAHIYQTPLQKRTTGGWTVPVLWQPKAYETLRKRKFIPPSASSVNGWKPYSDMFIPLKWKAGPIPTCPMRTY